MNFLKPIFFGKYKTDIIYDYDESWQDQSIFIEDKRLSILVKQAENPKGIVVLSHPMHQLGKQFFVDYGHTNFYHKAGYTIILFDFNGFGRSEDRGFVFPEDVKSVINLAKTTFSNLPLYLHGVSFGASQIIAGTIAAGEHLVDGLIIESATSSNLDYYKHRNKRKEHIVLNTFSSIFPSKNAHNLFYNTIQEIKETKLLFIYGNQDVITPIWMGEKIYNNAISPKQFERFDAAHLTTISDEPKRYSEVIFNFLS